MALNEGATLTRTLSFADPGADTWTATVDYGDGSEIVTIPAADLADRAFDLNHTYSDNGAFTVLVNVSDGDGGTATDTFRVTASNLPPTAGAGAGRTVAEGTPVTLTATVSDPGAGDTHAYQWSVSASNGQVVPAGTDPSFTLTPTDQGTYTVSLRVTDDDGAFASDVVVISVSDVAPAVALSGAATVPEGSPYLLTIGAVADPGADTVAQYRVHWGDGTPIETLTAAAVAAAGGNVTHTYQDGPATRSISVDLVDEDGTHAGAGDLNVAVQNVTPVITSLSPSATTLAEGGTLTLGGSFEDAGLLDAHTVRIDWGDGTAKQSVSLAPGARQFGATHQYRDDSPSGARITVQVNDRVADSAAVTSDLSVLNVAPTFKSLALSATSATEGAMLTLTGDVDDAGALDSHTATIDWGDGTPIAAPTLAADGTFSLNHRYDVPG